MQFCVVLKALTGAAITCVASPPKNFNFLVVEHVRLIALLDCRRRSDKGISIAAPVRPTACGRSNALLSGSLKWHVFANAKKVTL